MKMDAYDLAKKFGSARRAAPLLSQFALSVAKLANRGLVKPSDAAALYQTYIEAAGIAPQQSKKSRMVQISKLKKVIEVGALDGGPDMFGEVLSLYNHDSPHHASAYEGMVHIARRSAKANRALGKQTVRAILEGRR